MTNHTDKMENNIEEIWDVLCSDLEILQDKKKKDLVREYGRRIRKAERDRAVAIVEREIVPYTDTGKLLEKIAERLKTLDI